MIVYHVIHSQKKARETKPKAIFYILKPTFKNVKEQYKECYKQSRITNPDDIIWRVKESIHYILQNI